MPAGESVENMGKKRNKVEIFKLEDRVLFEAGAVDRKSVV